MRQSGMFFRRQLSVFCNVHICIFCSDKLLRVGYGIVVLSDGSLFQLVLKPVAGNELKGRLAVYSEVYFWHHIRSKLISIRPT